MRQSPRYPILLIPALLIFSAASSLFTCARAEEARAGARAVVLIHDVFELQNMSQDLGGSYELANDIDASNTRGWNEGLGFGPIGPEFSGSLDGRGFTITSLFINRPEERYVGLFRSTQEYSESDVILNLTLASVNITGSEFVGAIAGNISANVLNCRASGAVSGDYCAGGLAGTCGMRNIKRCSFSGAVRSLYGPAGGIAGSGSAAILDCYSAGEVIGNRTVGGLVGACEMGQLHRSFSTANVQGDSEVGGFVGANYGNISRCFSTGKVNGTSRVGGFAGYDNNAGSWVGDIRDCFSTGPVFCTKRSGYPGGFIGEANMSPPDSPFMDYGYIERCYSAGRVGGGHQPGGFMAMNQGATVVDCYWDTDTSECGFSTNGTGRGTSDMMRQATFTNWDFDTTWRIDEGSSYPYLRNMPSSSENNPPAILTAPPTGAFTGRPYSVQFSAADADGDAIAWEMTSNASWLSMTAGGLLAGTPPSPGTGVYTVAVAASDGRGGMASLTFELTVSEWRHTLEWLTVPADKEIPEGENFSFIVAAVDNDAGHTVRYAVHSYPDSSLTMNETTGIARWDDVPSPGHTAGSNLTYEFNITASDGQVILHHILRLTVLGKPLPPEPTIVSLTGPDNVTVKSSAIQTFSVEARSPTNATLIYEWKEDNLTLSTEKSFSRRFAPGNHTLVLLIGDGNYVITRTFNFTVAPPPKVIETKPVSAPGFGAGVAAAAVTIVVVTGLFWRRERR